MSYCPGKNLPGYADDDMDYYLNDDLNDLQEEVREAF